MIQYPAKIDDDTSIPDVIDNITSINGEVINRLKQAIIAIETELSTKPSGIYANVKARFDAIEGIVGNLQIISLDGDLGGTLLDPTVVGFQGRPVSSVNPGIGEAYVWNGIAWAPTVVGGGGSSITFGGDLTGTSISQTVVRIQGHPIASTSPADGSVLTWDATDGYWIAKPDTDSTFPTGPAGGNLSGTYPNPIVAKINNAIVPAAGSLTTGNVLQVSGSSTLSYAAVNLGGGANFVTGSLPAGNQAAQTMSGDVTGTTASSTVVSITGSAGNVNIVANQTTLDATGLPGSIPVIGNVTSAQSTSASPVIAFTYAHPDNTLVDFVVTFAGRNHSNNGDFYRADFVFTSQRFGGGAPTLFPNPPTAANVRSNGAGSTYLPSITTSSNNVLLNVAGNGSTVVDWSCVFQIQIRS